MDLTPEPLLPAPPSGWTEPVLVCSPDGREVVSGVAWPQDGHHLSGGLWFHLEGEPFRVWPALEDEAVLIFSRHPEVFVAARVSEVRARDQSCDLGLSVLGQVPA